MIVMATIERASESRRSLRRPLRLSTSAATHPSGTVAIVVRDLSPTGLLFESRVRFAVNEQLRIVLPQDVVADAKIVWERGGVYGCEFDTRLSLGALSAALLKGEPHFAVESGHETAEGGSRWPTPVRLAIILAGAALLWAAIASAVGALR